MPLSKRLDQLVVRSAMLSKKELFHYLYSRRVLSLREKRTVTCLNRLFFCDLFYSFFSVFQHLVRTSV